MAEVPLFSLFGNMSVIHKTSAPQGTTIPTKAAHPISFDWLQVYDAFKEKKIFQIEKMMNEGNIDAILRGSNRFEHGARILHIVLQVGFVAGLKYILELMRRSMDELKQKLHFEATDEAGRSPLHYICALHPTDFTPDHRTTLELFLTETAQFASSTFQAMDLLACDDDKKTPLYYAFEKGNLDAARLVLAAVPDPEKSQFGYGDVHVYILLGDKENVRKAINAGWPVAKCTFEDISLMHLAALTNEPEMIRLFISRGGNANQKDIENRTPLHYAAITGAISATNELITQGADLSPLDKQEYTPLHYAIAFPNLELADLFVKKKGPNALEAFSLQYLKFGSEKELKDMGEYLIKHGADPNALGSDGHLILHAHAAQGHFDIVKLLCEGLTKKANAQAFNKKGFNILHFACMTPNGSPIISYGIQHGVSVNKANIFKITPLMISAIFGNYKNGVTLINANAEVNVTSLERASALHFACVWGHVLLVKALITYGARLNTQDRRGRTPLHMAAVYNQVEVIKMFVKEKYFSNSTATDDPQEDALKNVSLNTQDALGRTALMNAILVGNKSIAEVLIRAGADVNIPDNQKCTPYSMALTMERTDLAALLKSSELSPPTEKKKPRAQTTMVSLQRNESSTNLPQSSQTPTLEASQRPMSMAQPRSVSNPTPVNASLKSSSSKSTTTTTTTTQLKTTSSESSNLALKPTGAQLGKRASEATFKMGKVTSMSGANRPTNANSSANPIPSGVGQQKKELQSLASQKSSPPPSIKNNVSKMHSSVSSLKLDSAKKERTRATVLSDFKGEDETQLSIKKGQALIVLKQPEGTGWWGGKIEGTTKIGWFPKEFVKIMDE